MGQSFIWPEIELVNYLFRTIASLKSLDDIAVEILLALARTI